MSKLYGKRTGGRFACLTVILLMYMSACLLAETPPLWGELQPGPHGIGFRTIEQYDNSRVVSGKYDYFGNAVDGIRERPIQVCLWYPAVTDDEAWMMVYGEYAFPQPQNTEFIDMLSTVQNRDLTTIGRIVGNDRGFLTDLISFELMAVRDAVAAEGNFPLLYYFPNMRGSYCDNVALCEFLASHGFIVATTHPRGAAQFNPELTGADLLAVVRDAEFTLSLLRDLPNVDGDKLGAFGYASGGAAALLLRMINGDIEAVASLGGAWSFEIAANLVMTNPYFSAERVHLPLLDIYPTGQHPLDKSLIDTLAFADRFRYGLPTSEYADFSMARAILGMLPDSVGEMHRGRLGINAAVAEYMRQFFNAHLRGNTTALAFLTGAEAAGPDIEYAFLAADPVPPTSVQFMEIINQHGAARAAEIYDRFKVTYPGRIAFPEGPMNMRGYQLFNTGNIEEAVIIQRMNAEAHPQSANAWDSYGEICLAAQDTVTAIKCYEKSLELTPGDPNLNDNFRQILLDNARRVLEQYKKE